MDTIISKNPTINNFLVKYEKKDWNSVLIKLCLIAIEYLKDESIKKNFYSFEILDEILNDLRNMNYKRPKPEIINQKSNIPILTPTQEKIIHKMNNLKMSLKEPLPQVDKNKPYFPPKNSVKFLNKFPYNSQNNLKNNTYSQNYNNTLQSKNKSNVLTDSDFSEKKKQMFKSKIENEKVNDKLDTNGNKVEFKNFNDKIDFNNNYDKKKDLDNQKPYINNEFVINELKNINNIPSENMNNSNQEYKPLYKKDEINHEKPIKNLINNNTNEDLNNKIDNTQNYNDLNNNINPNNQYFNQSYKSYNQISNNNNNQKMNTNYKNSVYNQNFEGTYISPNINNINPNNNNQYSNPNNLNINNNQYSNPNNININNNQYTNSNNININNNQYSNPNNINTNNNQYTNSNNINTNNNQYSNSNNINTNNNQYSNSNNVELNNNNQKSNNINKNNNNYNQCLPKTTPNFNATNIIEDFHLRQAKYDQYPYLNYEYNLMNLNRYNQCGDKPKTYEIQQPYSLNK